MKTYKHKKLGCLAEKRKVGLGGYRIYDRDGNDIDKMHNEELIENSLDRKEVPEKDFLLEELSDLEHQQRICWAKSIIKSEDISQDRIDRWNTFFVNYEYLDEDIKEYDREWARKAKGIIERQIPKITRKELLTCKCDGVLTMITVIDLLKEKNLYKE